MKKLMSLATLILIVFAMFFSVNASDISNNINKVPEEAIFEKVLSIKVGVAENQVAYSPKIEGIANEGPSSFTVDDNKNIYILDSLNKKIIVFNKDKFLYHIPIDFVNYARDILYNKGSLYLLDESNVVYAIDLKGDIEKIYWIPNNINVVSSKGLALNSNGNIVIQYDVNEYDIENKKNSEGYSFNYKKIFTKYYEGGVKIISGNWLNKKEIKIDFTEGSGCVNIIGKDKYNNLYVSVEEDVPNSPLVLCEHTIRKIDSNGNQVAFARIPLEEFYNFPNKFAHVTEDGELYIMALKEDSTDIYKVTLGKTYKSKMNELKNKAMDEWKKIKEVNRDIVSILYIPDIPTRSDVYYRAEDMINLSWTYNKNNTYKPQSYVEAPDHLSGITSFPSSQVGIPYCWGGFDGIDTSSAPSSWSNFKDAMNKGKYAGNIYTGTSGWVSGTAGLDCSGFASAAYAFSQKYNTTGLYNMANKISYDAVKYMDIFVKPGSHVLFFYSWNSDKTLVNSKESTTSGYGDKAKNYSRTRSWLTTNGYYAGTMWP
jgi:cell wall-associated NlpC family hydrolase